MTLSHPPAAPAPRRAGAAASRHPQLGAALPVLRARIKGWSARHPVLTDAGLVALLMPTGADSLHHGFSADLLWFATLWLPVIFRRVAPVAVFLLVGIVAVMQWAGDIPTGADLAVLVVLYTVAAHRGLATALAATAAVQVGAVMAALRFGGDQWPRFLLLLTTLVVAAFFLGVTQRARRSHLAALTDRADRVEREAEQQAALAAAAERTRIAREMHDIVAHSLSVMVSLADGAALTENSDQARSAMRQVARTGREALADTRRVLNVLRTEADRVDRTPLPGIQSIEALLTAVRATELEASLSVTGTVFPIPDAAQLAIYRIVQEALTNTLKHGLDADRAMVRIVYDHPQITVDIIDNGVQPPVPSPPTPVDGEHGLLGIRERAELFGGHSTAGWANGGWRVAVTLIVGDVTPAVGPQSMSTTQPASR